jgi:hypothetical protein
VGRQISKDFAGIMSQSVLQSTSDHFKLRAQSSYILIHRESNPVYDVKYGRSCAA